MASYVAVIQVNTTLKAALWMIGTIAAFSIMAIAGREVSFALDTFEIMMYRSLVGLIIVGAFAAGTGTWRQINRRDLHIHLARNTAHFTGQNLWFFAVATIPMAQVFALEFTSPIWVLMLSPFLLGERFTWFKALAVLVAFSGVLVVLRPDVAMGDGMVSLSNPLHAGLLAAASSAIFFALSIMLTKRLTRTETLTCILFYLTAMQLVLGIISAGYDGDIAIPTAQTLPFVIIIGFCGLIGHFCLTKALAIAPATIVVPIDFVRLPIIAVLGMLLYGEAADTWVFIGAGLIFAGNYLNIWIDARNVLVKKTQADDR